MEKNYVITYQSWEGINATSEEEAIKIFKKDHSDVDIIEVKG